jgi:dolichol-phosphate mannosyltransferase
LYNEEKNVRPLAERIQAVMEKAECRWEIVFALDPCPDRTREEILALADAGVPVRLIVFSRRIGKPLSLIAGLDHCAGDAAIVIDADLQDPPELMERMIHAWEAGAQVVIAQRTSRKGEGFLYLCCARFFYWLLEKITDVKAPRDAGDYRLLDRRVVREVCRIRERHGFLRGLTALAGFRTELIPFDRDPRHAGSAQISLTGAMNIALDGIIPFSRTPVRLVLFAGLAGLCLWLVITGGWTVSGVMRGLSHTWFLELLGLLILLFTAIALAALGVLGEYLVRTYEEARDRPLYVVDELVEAPTLHRSLREHQPAGEATDGRVGARRAVHPSRTED